MMKEEMAKKIKSNKVNKDELIRRIKEKKKIKDSNEIVRK